MRVYVPKLNKEGMGGGNTFVRNLRKHTTLELTDQSKDAEVMFVANPMWAEREDFEESRRVGRKVVLRLDNIPEDWNNRGTAISKLKDFIVMSDVLIYQSDWSSQKYTEFCESNGINLVNQEARLIFNGVDTEIFKPEGDTLAPRGNPTILYVKSSRNENKRYPEAMEIYRRYWQANNRAALLLAGQFAEDIRQYNFGFYNGENYQYLGVQPPEVMAAMYRSADVLLFPAYADCAPNVVLEAMACGCVPIIHTYGGAVEFTCGMDYAVDINGFGPDYERMMKLALSKEKEAVSGWVAERFNIRDMVKQYERVIYGE